jgi:hypothetical protein
VVAHAMRNDVQLELALALQRSGPFVVQSPVSKHIFTAFTAAPAPLTRPHRIASQRILRKLLESHASLSPRVSPRYVIKP